MSLGETKVNKVNSKNNNSKKMADNKKSNNKNNKKEPDQFKWQKAGKTSFVWVLVIISALFLSNLFTNQIGEEIEVQYSEYRSFLTENLIAKARVVDQVFHGELSEPRIILIYLNYRNHLTFNITF